MGEELVYAVPPGLKNPNLLILKSRGFPLHVMLIYPLYVMEEGDALVISALLVMPLVLEEGKMYNPLWDWIYQLSALPLIWKLHPFVDASDVMDISPQLKLLIVRAFPLNVIGLSEPFST